MPYTYMYFIYKQQIQAYLCLGPSPEIMLHHIHSSVAALLQLCCSMYRGIDMLLDMLMPRALAEIMLHHIHSRKVSVGVPIKIKINK
jgi:hypothetical protein